MTGDNNTNIAVYIDDTFKYGYLHIRTLSTPPIHEFTKIVGEFDYMRQTNSLVLDQIYPVINFLFIVICNVNAKTQINFQHLLKK